MLSDIVSYILENRDQYLDAVTRHITICAITLAICIAVGIPLGYFVSKNEKLSAPVIAFINGFKMIPVVASFFLLIPIFGLGMTPAVIVLGFYGLYTIVISTQAGIKNIDRSVIESAQGMGFSPRQICLSVEMPLVAPFMVNGIRTAAIEVISGATIASYIGAGGLGDIILWGMSNMNYAITFAGGGMVILLVVICDGSLSLIQTRLSRNASGKCVING